MRQPTAIMAIALPMGAVNIGAVNALQIGVIGIRIITAVCDIRAAADPLKRGLFEIQ